ncbi:hypothetical protein K488DRAFT_75125 [Vararia minispora EC-137]|uniref:Uncharacterized protein n=1 Tax=Vararia minispora EC-137 TaxID=1314806 RepID=A0ACB8Q536_9AGAM|nr:hypothetical protein K488DRAFT_75125 [Vararia minispora EC-137]
MDPTVSSFNTNSSGSASFERMSTSPRPEEQPSQMQAQMYMSEEIQQDTPGIVQPNAPHYPAYIMLIHGLPLPAQGPTIPYNVPPGPGQGIHYMYGHQPMEPRPYEPPTQINSNQLPSVPPIPVAMHTHLPIPTGLSAQAAVQNYTAVPDQWIPGLASQPVLPHTVRPSQSPPRDPWHPTSGTNKKDTEKQRITRRRRQTSESNSDSDLESSEREYDSDEESNSGEESEEESDHSPKRQKYEKKRQSGTERCDPSDTYRSSSAQGQYAGRSAAKDQEAPAPPLETINMIYDPQNPGAYPHPHQHTYLAHSQGFQPVKPTLIVQKLGMPLPKTRGAPPTFKGHYGDVENFLMHFEELCHIHGIIDGPTKCRMVVRYCSTNVRNTVEGISGFAKGNWQRWRKYTRGYVEIAGNMRRARNLSKDEYQRSFWDGIHSHFAQRLEDKLELMYPNWDRKKPWTYDQTTKAAELLLKRGTYARRRQRLQKEDASDSDSDSDDESESSSSEGEEKPTRTQSKKSTASRTKPTLEKTKPVSPKARVAVAHAPEIPPEAITAATVDNRLAKINSEEHRLFEETVSRMSSFSRADPRYAMAYMRAITLEPASQEWLAKPLPPQEPTHHGRNVAQTFGVVSYPPPNQYSIPQMSAQNMHVPQQGFRSQNTEKICYGCGQQGHTIRQCEVIADDIRQQRVQWNRNGFLEYPNGRPVRNTRGETYHQTIVRETPLRAPPGDGQTTPASLPTPAAAPATSHFVRGIEESALISSLSDSDTDKAGIVMYNAPVYVSDSEYDSGSGYEGESEKRDDKPGSTATVYQTTQTRKKTRLVTRSQNGIRVSKPERDPEQFKMSAKKQVVKKVTSIPGERKTHPTKTDKKSKPPPMFTLPTVQVQDAEVDVPMSGDDEGDKRDKDEPGGNEKAGDSPERQMEDMSGDPEAQRQKGPKRSRKKKAVQVPELTEAGYVGERRKRAQRIAPIAREGDPQALYRWLLDVKVEWPIRDILANCEGIRNQLLENVRKKSYQEPEVVDKTGRSLFVSGSRERFWPVRPPILRDEECLRIHLLEILAVINGYEIPAIIDTGSQLNLMSSEVAEVIRQPRGSRPHPWKTQTEGKEF